MMTPIKAWRIRRRAYGFLKITPLRPATSLLQGGEPCLHIRCADNGGVPEGHKLFELRLDGVNSLPGLREPLLKLFEAHGVDLAHIHARVIAGARGLQGTFVARIRSGSPTPPEFLGGLSPDVVAHAFAPPLLPSAICSSSPSTTEEPPPEPPARPLALP